MVVYRCGVGNFIIKDGKEKGELWKLKSKT